MALIIDIVRHQDAVAKGSWHGRAADKPLTKLGHEQARALADALSCEPIDGLYRSPAIRCEQTLAPLADRLGMDSVPIRELAKNASQLPPGWEKRAGSTGHRGAHAAGSLSRAIERIRREHEVGRVVVCGHLRTITSLASFLVAANRIAGLPELTQHGQWYRFRFKDGTVSAEMIEIPNFPR